MTYITWDNAVFTWESASYTWGDASSGQNWYVMLPFYDPTQVLNMEWIPTWAKCKVFVMSGSAIDFSASVPITASDRAAGPFATEAIATQWRVSASVDSPAYDVAPIVLRNP